MNGDLVAHGVNTAAAFSGIALLVNPIFRSNAIAKLAFSFSARSYQRGAFSLLNRLAIVFFGFLNIFFMVRLLPKEEIGVWSLFLSVTTILELLRNGFIRNSLITHLVSAPTEDEQGRVIAASWALHLALTILTSVGLYFAAAPLSAFWEAPHLEKLFYIYIIRALLLVPALQFEYLQQCEVNFKAIFWGTIVRLAPVGIYVVIKYVQVVLLNSGEPPTLFDIAIVQVLATLASLGIGYYYVRQLKVFRWAADLGSIRLLSGFGKYSMGTTISSMIIKNTDSWMIGRMISVDGVASYNPALRISNLIEVPTLAVANVVFPQVYRKLEAEGAPGLQDVYTKSVSLILAMMVPLLIPLYVFSDEVIQLIFTTQYREAAPILRVTLFFTVLIPFNRQFGTLMDGVKKPKVNFYLLVVMGLINIVTNYFLIGMYGPIGAAYGTLLAYIFIFIANQVILYRLFEINVFLVFPSIFTWYRTGWKLLVETVSRKA